MNREMGGVVPQSIYDVQLKPLVQHVKNNAKMKSRMFNSLQGTSLDSSDKLSSRSAFDENPLENKELFGKP